MGKFWRKNIYGRGIRDENGQTKGLSCSVFVEREERTFGVIVEAENECFHPLGPIIMSKKNIVFLYQVVIFHVTFSK